ncbi:MAG: hypothetical protein KF782_15435 [Labilithrix sp.]|nr:hypothetical protein [Labilithrix sp.]
MTAPVHALGEGERIYVTGPGALHGEIGFVRAIRDDGAVLFESERHGDLNWLDPRCVARIREGGAP